MKHSINRKLAYSLLASAAVMPFMAELVYAETAEPTNTDIQDPDKYYSEEPKQDGEVVAASESKGQPSVPDSLAEPAGTFATDVMTETGEPAKTFIDDKEIKYQGNWGVDWYVTTDGELIFEAGQLLNTTEDNLQERWNRYSQEITNVSVHQNDNGNTLVLGTQAEYLFASQYSYQEAKVLSIDTKNFDTSKTISMAGMFKGCKVLTSLDLEGFKTENVMNMNGMFYGCSSIETLDLQSFSTSHVIDMNQMFQSCHALVSVNLSSFNTADVTDMAEMFHECDSLKSLNIKGFNTAKVTSMRGMFSNCTSLKMLDLTSFDTSNVTNMDYMFSGNTALENISFGNQFDTSKVTTMWHMFHGCKKLAQLDLANFKTENVVDMNGMFGGCSALTEIDVSHFNTSNVVDMTGMFDGCSGLKELDLQNFDFSTVTSTNRMFGYCANLKTIQFGETWAPEIVNMQMMFLNCYGLEELDLHAFQTSKLETTASMFEGCTNLKKLDISGLDTSLLNTEEYSGTSINYTAKDMFKDLRRLNELQLGPKTLAGAAVLNDFKNCFGEGWAQYGDPSNVKGTDGFTGLETGVWVRAKSGYVAFDTDGGTYVAFLPSLPYGTVLEMKDYVTEKEGHEFQGWYLDRDFAKEAGTAVTVTGDTVLYAKWKKNSVIVSAGEGYETLFENMDLHYGDKFDPTGTVPEKEGLGFEGWYLEPDFQTKVDGPIELTGDLTLYPKWKELASADPADPETPPVEEGKPVDNDNREEPAVEETVFDSNNPSSAYGKPAVETGPVHLVAQSAVAKYRPGTNLKQTEEAAVTEPETRTATGDGVEGKVSPAVSKPVEHSVEPESEAKASGLPYWLAVFVAGAAGFVAWRKRKKED